MERKGTYSIRAAGPCDTEQASVQAEPIKPIREETYNVFTPNGDAAHPTFYNRWGKEVYEAEHYENDWDGKGLPDGTYFYSLRVPCLPETLRGIVTITREGND